MTPEKIDLLIANCYELEHHTRDAGKEYMHTSARCFAACMNAFNGTPRARSITFKVFYDSPIIGTGEGSATIYDSGVLAMHFEPGN